jgi:hypothetical protein
MAGPTTEENHLRKSIVGGIAVCVAIACGSTAVAQDSPVQMTAKLKPSKAGTKKKPKSGKLTTVITNTQNDKIVTTIDIQLPKTFKVSGKGFKTCAEKPMVDSAGSACPKGSKVGSGVAEAKAGINTPNRVDVIFDVTAFVAGPKKINFLLVARGLSNVYNTPGVLKKTKKGPRLVVSIPGGAASPQQPIPNFFATLTKLTTTLGAKSGKHALIATTGCKKHKQPMSATLSYATPPATAGGATTPAGSAKASAFAKC